MAFIQPWVLLALPLIALPVVIHLMHQRRHKPMAWGAMMFLQQARKMNAGIARLRYWLILALRVLAVGMLIVGLSRPLSTGWLGRFGTQATTSILIVDRSPSMELQESNGGLSKRETALQRLDQWFQTTQPKANRILIATGLPKPQAVPQGVRLSGMEEVAATASTSHLAELFQQALDYMKNHETGPTDVWICSDLARSDWELEDGRWSDMRKAFAGLPATRLMLLSYPNAEANNVSIRVERVVRRSTQQGAELVMDIRLRQAGASLQARRIPVVIEVGGVRSTTEVLLQGRESQEHGIVIPIDPKFEQGVGVVSIPADANEADNTFHFAFASPPSPTCVVVSDDEEIGVLLELAAGTSLSADGACESRWITHQRLAEIDWQLTSMILWHGDLPRGAVAEQLQRFVAEGKSVLFLPKEASVEANAVEAMVADDARTAGDLNETSLFDARWGSWQFAKEKPLKVGNWRADADLLQRVASGEPLPVQELEIYQCRNLQAKRSNVLAQTSERYSLVDTHPNGSGTKSIFVASCRRRHLRISAWKGWFCMSWSSDCWRTGIQGLSPAKMQVAGEANLPASDTWKPMDETKSGDSVERANDSSG